MRLLAELGVELIERREAEAAAKAEAEHKALLEEQSRLKEQYQQYLGGARRAALDLIAKKRRAADGKEIESLRRKARIVIDEVQDATKKRIPGELDKHYAALAAAISITPQELRASDPRLSSARKQLGNASLDWVDRAAIMYAMCPTKEQAAVIAGNIQLREQLSEDEANAIDECNHRRLVLGLTPLAIDIKLVACGRDHSKDMIEHNFFAHESPLPGKAKFWERAKKFGTTAAGENIASGYANGNAVIMGWWYSPGHLKNMMSRGWKRIGVGQTQQHYTQLFGR